jgi:flagellum-specific ATP synthase
LKSISRLSNRIWSSQQRTVVLTYRALLSRYEDTRDLRMLGGYHPGADLELDRAITLAPMLYDALTQSPLAPPSGDAFGEIAERLCGAAGVESAPR